MTLRTEALLKKYPIRNSAWSLNSDGSFCVESSALGSKKLDPWNRYIDNAKVTPIYAGDELQYWKAYTTVEGVRVNLVIFND